MDAAKEISKYLSTGMHHATPEGQKAINNIIKFVERHNKILSSIDRPDFPTDKLTVEMREYLLALKEGERVIETSMGALHGRKGVVYFNSEGSICVKWDLGDGQYMGTTVTGGARRLIKDI